MDKHPLKPTVTALVLGNLFAKKTTLIKSITKTYHEKQANHLLVGQVKQISEDTGCIEISNMCERGNKDHFTCQQS